MDEILERQRGISYSINGERVKLEYDEDGKPNEKQFAILREGYICYNVFYLIFYASMAVWVGVILGGSSWDGCYLKESSGSSTHQDGILAQITSLQEKPLIIHAGSDFVPSMSHNSEIEKKAEEKAKHPVEKKDN